TSRPRMQVLDVTSTPEEIVARIAESPRSRYPIVDGDLDHVIGVLHIKDVIRAAQRGRPGDAVRLARPLPSVAASMPADQLLALLTRDRIHSSLVVDEAGGTLGFVTLDDVIAEVMDDEVGDEAEEAVHDSDGSLIVDGEVTL